MPAHLSKTETVIKLLRRSKGASISQLQSATGWQPHSIRAALTKLRMTGHDVSRRCEGRTSRYYITRSGTEG
jgi:predicted ArsR family transcriptional regulator